MPCPRDPSRTDVTRRAYAGSQRQIQAYVNERTSELSHAVAEALQPCMRIPGQGGHDSEIDPVSIPKLIRSRFRDEVGHGFRF